MDTKELLVPGQALELVVWDGPYKGRYRSHVDETGEKVISVAAPFFENATVPLREGTALEVFFYDELTAYSFEAKIMQRIAVPVAVLVLEILGNIKKVQRRNYVRVPAFYPVLYRVVTREGLSDEHEGHMMDISGGGMRFNTTEKLENKGLIFTQLHLPTGEIKTPGRICRVHRDEDMRRYVISVEFYDLSEKERDLIIKCVFTLQRETLKKGLN